jgi:C4-dicarboxylate transporter/malic acid transport protein
MEGASLAQPRPSVQFFNPAWFASVMGTGVVAVALWQFGQQLGWLKPLGLLVYVLTLLMLVGLLAVWLVKAVRFPQAVVKDLHHPMVSQMLPTLPIALLVAALASWQMGPAVWGEATATALAQGLYLVGAPLIFVLGVLVAFLVFNRLKLPLEQASGAWFIPPVSALLVPLVGGVLLPSFPAAWQKEVWLWNGLFLGVGLLLFVFVLTTLLQRLYVFGRLDTHLLPSLWIGLAPVGLSILAPWRWLEAGAAAGLVSAGWLAALPVLGVALWGLGGWWFVLSLLVLLDTLLAKERRAEFHFTPGWWGFVFPLGAFTLATLALGRAWESAMLGLFSWVLLLALLGFWLVVLVLSAKAWLGLSALLPPSR